MLELGRGLGRAPELWRALETALGVLGGRGLYLWAAAPTTAADRTVRTVAPGARTTILQTGVRAIDEIPLLGEIGRTGLLAAILRGRARTGRVAAMVEVVAATAGVVAIRLRDQVRRGLVAATDHLGSTTGRSVSIARLCTRAV